MKICVIVLVGEKFIDFFLKSYNSLYSGIEHDLLVVHRDNYGLNNTNSIQNNNIIFENKIINGADVPHRAFGAYRYYFNKYKNKYDFFVFASDDVIIRRRNWLKNIIEVMFSNKHIGFGSSQIFNGGKKYPHPSHIRSPFWFAKTEILNKIHWEFDNDHDGEMKIGDQLSNIGCVGIQIGNKINLAYDSMEKDHITQLLEIKYFEHKKLKDPFNEQELYYFEKMYENINQKNLENYKIISPYNHIKEQNIFIDIEPFNNLIYNNSLENARKYDINIKNLNNNINIYEF